jgi:hypothetical protein
VCSVFIWIVYVLMFVCFQSGTALGFSPKLQPISMSVCFSFLKSLIVLSLQECNTNKFVYTNLTW